LVAGAPVSADLELVTPVVSGDDLVIEAKVIADNTGGTWVIVLKNTNGCCYVAGFVTVTIP
jgi:hypothetical protein